MKISSVLMFNKINNKNVLKASEKDEVKTSPHFPKTNNATNPLIDVHYSQLFVSKSKLSFKAGISTLVPKIVGKISLEDKVAWMLNQLLYGDILLIGKNLKKAQELLQHSKKSLMGVINNVYFIPDAKLKDGALLFQRTNEGAPHVTNLGKNLLKINVPPNVPITPRTIPLQQGKGFYALPGSEIFGQNFFMNIKYNTEHDLSSATEMFSTKYSFLEDNRGAIESLNSKTIDLLIPSVRKKGKSITFKDVGGMDSVIKRLRRDILNPLKYPAAHEGVQSHGVLLYGPAGTGKSLVAEALANESGAHFIKLNGLELSSKWVGETEKNWRKLFDEAKSHKSCIIFLDEFEAVARKRGGGNVYADDTVNQLLTLLSDVEKNNNRVYLITATNNINAVDPAIIRAGRIGNKIFVGPPETIQGTKQILDIHTRNKTISEMFDKEEFAKKLFDVKATGADIADITYKAKLYGFDRTGITEKMNNGTFKNMDLAGFKILSEDFEKAFNEFKQTHKSLSRKPIGFNQ